MLFKKIKETITDLAYSAVSYAENALSTSSGQEKKRAAIAFLVSRSTIASPIKSFVIFMLTNFIDKAIENAVEYMNEVRNEE